MANIGGRIEWNEQVKSQDDADTQKRGNFFPQDGTSEQDLKTSISESPHGVTCSSTEAISTKFLDSFQPIGTVPWVFLDALIQCYCELAEPLILDATVNKGRIWGRGKSRYKYIGMDIDPTVKSHVVGDNTNMPFGDATFDIVVYDPPHVPNQGKSMFARPYGTAIKSGPRGSLSHTYGPFLIEAARVLKPDGFLLVKLMDYTHCGKFHFATAEFALQARGAGFELHQYYILPRKSVIIDPKWKKAHHPRQNHSTWMVFKRPAASR